MCKKLNVAAVFILLLVSVRSNICYGQESHLRFKATGKVIDDSGVPVAYANIVIPSLSIGTISDESGNYLLKRLPKGTFEIEVSALGFETVRREINIKDKSIDALDFVLRAKAENLDEVIVATKSKASELRQSAKSVSIVETENVKLKTTDLGEVLSKVQGVNVRRSGGLGSNTRFSLNGLTDEQVRFFIDGVPLDFMGYTTGIANVPVGLIERVDIYKGVVPVEFGADALGGAVNLVTSQENYGFSGSVSYQLGSFGTHRTALDISYRPENSKFYTRGNIFYDFSLNNYEIDVEIPDEQGRLSEFTVERFHDTYEALGLHTEFGLTNLSWADKIAFALFANDYSQDIQNNNVMTIPYGEVTSNERAFGGLIRWNKQWSSKFDSDLTLGYSNNRISFQDISECVYDWFGNCIAERVSPGEIGIATDQVLWDDSYYARYTTNYTLSGQSKLKFTSAPTLVSRTGEERRPINPDAIDPLGAERSIFSFVNGLEYQWNSLHKSIENISFVKSYLQDVNAEEFLPGNRIENLDRSTHDFGFGNNIRINMPYNLFLKMNYEWAIRNPTTQEIFGNGILIQPNLQLSPERSHNANIEINYERIRFDTSYVLAGLNAFFRRADNLIVLLGNEQLFGFQNVFTANSVGIEANMNWRTSDEKWQLSLNGTWQDFRNASRDGDFGDFEGDRIPNRPYLFANGSLQHQISGIFKSDDKLDIFWNTRYVHEFFRSWESAGIRQFKQVIPSQLVSNLGITYKFSFAKNLLAITGEIQNVTNEKVFDFFGIQRPGRAFFTKMTLQF